jgi:hypothetical protein
MWADTLLILFISVCTALLGEGELLNELKCWIGICYTNFQEFRHERNVRCENVANNRSTLLDSWYLF